MAWRALRAAAGWSARRNLHLQVEGLEHVPHRGPVIIAARHFHHLYDGCALIVTLPRPAHILVAGDWVLGGVQQALFGRACAAARWPVVQRPNGPHHVNPRTTATSFEQAATESMQLFHEGHILIVFPEGYPNVDPTYTPKTTLDEFLPFHRGFARLAQLARREGMDVPIVPAGFSYGQGTRWDVTLRFGQPRLLDAGITEQALTTQVEQDVHELSR